ncbi:NAD(P)H-dependent oxidoreductase [Paenibacillus sp. S150]|uniref:NAD(P)H-dependent oxidoreductase n=1 Tax=Paenibacillus sp. S150 TaxID=2749826 RepID=UPI001C57053E|nr:NAD(P)H-dependent oxidoreductase [Paenibacillus sp. S150]MBW4082014.1 NAD(P)H-dependent oxidoreductase [Paenibacillus sp. S150]
MKIAMINGSPKPANSNSAIMLRTLDPLVSAGNELTYYNLNKKPLTPEQYSELCRMDTLVIAFPLYVDGIPSHLFRMLAALEEHLKAERGQEIYVYAIINNGFFEGRQNHIALDILNHWCIRAGLHFGQGIGQGAGEMMGFLEKVPPGQGPLKNLGKAMQSLADNIQARSTGEAMLFSPNFPRFAWRFSATHSFWNAAAKKNGLKKKDLLRKL